jgi:putative selenium metabolism hydrolase
MSDLIAQAGGYEDEVVGLLRELISIQSTSCHEEEVARRMQSEMHTLGYDEVWIDPIGNVIGRIGDGATRIVLDAHIDTVGVADPESWTFDPFDGKVEDRIVFGRGASDNKGALAAQVLAGKLMVERGLDGADVTVFVVGTVMEEDCDGLALGYALTESIGDVDAVVLGECTNLDVYRGHRGRMEMKVASKGVSAHASAPERGVNPVTTLAPVILELAALNERLPDHEVLGKGTIAVSKIECSTASLNAIPDSCTIYLDRRLTEGETRASALAEVESLLENASARVELLTYREPSYTGLVLEAEK